MFVSVTTCRRTVNRVVELRLADASIRFLFLELVRALSVLLVLVLVGYKVCQWCEPILSVITTALTEACENVQLVKIVVGYNGR